MMNAEQGIMNDELNIDTNNFIILNSLFFIQYSKNKTGNQSYC